MNTFEIMTVVRGYTRLPNPEDIGNPLLKRFINMGAQFVQQVLAPLFSPYLIKSYDYGDVSGSSVETPGDVLRLMDAYRDGVQCSKVAAEDKGLLGIDPNYPGDAPNYPAVINEGLNLSIFPVLATTSVEIRYCKRIADMIEGLGTYTLGSELLSQGTFALHTLWTGSTTVSFPANHVKFEYASPYPTLTQTAANRAVAGKKTVGYHFSYEVISNTGSYVVTASVKTFSGETIALNTAVGVHTVDFWSSADADTSDFVIEVNVPSTVTAEITLGNLSLKEICFALSGDAVMSDYYYNDYFLAIYEVTASEKSILGAYRISDYVGSTRLVSLVGALLESTPTYHYALVPILPAEFHNFLVDAGVIEVSKAGYGRFKESFAALEQSLKARLSDTLTANGVQVGA
jgi:hypothetical protein